MQALDGATELPVSAHRGEARPCPSVPSRMASGAPKRRSPSTSFARSPPTTQVGSVRQRRACLRDPSGPPAWSTGRPTARAPRSKCREPTNPSLESSSRLARYPRQPRAGERRRISGAGQAPMGLRPPRCSSTRHRAPARQSGRRAGSAARVHHPSGSLETRGCGRAALISGRPRHALGPCAPAQSHGEGWHPRSDVRSATREPLGVERTMRLKVASIRLATPRRTRRGYGCARRRRVKRLIATSHALRERDGSANACRSTLATLSLVRKLNLGWSHAHSRPGHSVACVNGRIAEPREVCEQPTVVQTHRHSSLVDRAIDRPSETLSDVHGSASLAGEPQPATVVE